MNSNYLPVREAWLALAHEDALEPELPIIDAHHHFYARPGWTYLLPEYLQDAQSGHNIQASVYMQALTHYRTTGPEALKPVGETDYVAQATAQLDAAPQVAQGIVAYADLRLGAAVREVLEAHAQAGQGRLRGIRHLATWDADASLANPLTAAVPHLLQDRQYRAGVRALAQQGLRYDAWVFWPQLAELAELADAFPELPIIVNHCGGVVRIGAYHNCQQQVFDGWRTGMRELAKRPNVVVKLGGLGMRINGFAFNARALPPSSVQLADTWNPWIQECIAAFGPDRCMFESNFPVDKGSYRFANGWNAFKRITQGFSDGERQQLFYGTAARVYRLF